MVLSPLRASIATLSFIVPLKFFRILVIGFHLFNQSSTKRLPTLNACLNFGVHYNPNSYTEMESRRKPTIKERNKDADSNYPQSGAQNQGLCLWKNLFRYLGKRPQPGSESASPKRQSGHLLPMWEKESWI